MKKADFDREVARRRGKRDVTAASANGQYPDEPDDPDDPDDPGEPDDPDEPDEPDELAEVVHAAHLGMAIKLADQYAGQLLYVEKVGWHRWDATRWAPGAASHARRAVHTLIARDRARVLALKVPEEDRLKKLKEIARFETASAISGILTEAAVLKQFWVDVKDLDADPWLLNCANGTLDLHTLALREHDPADLITKVTAASYTPGCRGATWTRFLQRVLPDPDVRDYLQRLTGLSLLGKVNGDKQVAPIMTGKGANGKTTYIEAAMFALGDYAMPADPDLLMARNGEVHPTGCADLLGKRLVSTTETKEGRKFDLALLKRLTGGDSIKARFMRQNFFTFKPSHLLLMATNHLPNIEDNTEAVWRRVRVIPFTVQIPDHERDGSLGNQLEAEADAVLSWIVEGWSDYRKRGGLDEPAAVCVATDAYREDADTVGRFIDAECLTGGAQSGATTKVLYERFELWAANEGCEPIGRVTFGRALTEKGFPVDPKSEKRLRRGICLREKPQVEDKS
jgi:putative DNA primase/helicase